MPFRRRSWKDPKNHLSYGGPDLPMGRSNFEEEGHAQTCPTTLWREMCKNGWTDGDIIWITDLRGSKKACIRWRGPNLMQRSNFSGKDMPVHAQRCSALSCANIAEPTEMPFGLWSRVGRRKKHCITWEHISATWRIQMNRPCASAMRPYVKSLWPLVIIIVYYVNKAANIHTQLHIQEYNKNIKNIFKTLKLLTCKTH